MGRMQNQRPVEINCSFARDLVVNRFGIFRKRGGEQNRGVAAAHVCVCFAGD